MAKRMLTVLGFALVTAMSLSSVLLQPAWADDICSEFSGELGNAAGCNTSTTADSVAVSLIQIAIGVMPVIALGVMIYGGVIFMTSQGDSGKTTKGRHIVIYGLVGLAVSILAWVIVDLVMRNILS